MTGPPWLLKKHRLCQRLINRFVKANDIVQSGWFSPAFIQPESKYNGAQRTVFRAQLVDIKTVPRAQHRMRFCAAVSGTWSDTCVRPLDLSTCACFPCGAERSLAIASRICCAWSRNSRATVPARPAVTWRQRTPIRQESLRCWPG